MVFAALFASPSELWTAVSGWGWRYLAVIASYAAVPLALLYGLHGFVRAWFDWLRVRRAFGWRRPRGASA